MRSFLFSVLLLTGCAAVGPEYERPQLELAPSFSVEAIMPPASGEPTSNPEFEDAWWRSFQDPLLNRLVEAAAFANLDLAAAVERVRASRALAGASRSARLPSVGLSASSTRQRASENGVIDLGVLSDLGFAEIENDVQRIGLDASWEIDLFGSVRRRIERAEAASDGTIEEARGLLLSILAETVQSYTELRGAQEQLELATANVRVDLETLEFSQNRRAAGLGNKLDVQRARTQWRRSQSRIPEFRARIEVHLLRLTVLLGLAPGKLPQDLRDQLVEAGSVPRSMEMVPTGLPSELLQRRPDLRAAEARLRAAVAGEGVATAELYPRFFLTGAAGFESVSFPDLFDSESGIFSIGPSVTWPLFRGGELRARLEAASARAAGEAASFQAIALRAVEDVEAALVRYAQGELQRRALVEATRSAREAEATARVQWQRGLVDYLAVLDAERVRIGVENELSRTTIRLGIDTIRLHKSLGGGWGDEALSALSSTER